MAKIRESQAPRLAEEHGSGKGVTMRKHADWMAQPDDRLLEFLAEAGPHQRREIRGALADAGRDMAYPKQYLEFRTATLLTHGLIERRQNGSFEITTRGREYLSGDLDVATLDEQRRSVPEDGGGSSRP